MIRDRLEILWLYVLIWKERFHRLWLEARINAYREHAEHIKATTAKAEADLIRTPGGARKLQEIHERFRQDEAA